MKKTILFYFLIPITLCVNAQITIFEDGFESYPDFTITNFGDWTMHDVDGTLTWGVYETDFPNEGSAMAGIIFNPSACSTDESSIPNYSTHSGEKYVTFWASGGEDVVSDNYLITPKIDLRNVTNPILTFFAKSLASNLSPTITPEEFELLISTTGNAIVDFTFNLGDVEYVRREGDYWDDFTHSLTPYIGEEIYIAIHHISPSSSYALHFDDFKIIDNDTAGTNDGLEKLAVTTFPNPFNNSITINSEENIDQIIIFNSLGQKVMNKKLSSKKTTINTTILKSGIYIAKIKSDLKTKTIKIVKR